MYGCRTGYVTDPLKDKNISIYGFPKDKDKRQEWIRCLPNVLDVNKVTDNMGVCALHWPDDVHKVSSNRHLVLVPSMPPSIFPNVPASCVPSSTPTTPLPSSKSTQAARVVDTDEMKQFREQDSLKLDTLCSDFEGKLKPVGYFSVCEKMKSACLLSHHRTGPVPNFSLYLTIREHPKSVILDYELYFSLRKVTHDSKSLSGRLDYLMGR